MVILSRTVVRFLVRTGRRSLVESLYLLTAPAVAAVGLVLVLGALGAATIGLLVRRRAPVSPVVLLPARLFADVERWRIAAVRSPTGVVGAPQRLRPAAWRREVAATSDPGLWLDVAHALVILPLTVITAVITGLWWLVGLAATTSTLRNPAPPSGSLRPMTLTAGNAQSHIDVSLGLLTPSTRFAFATAFGLAVLLLLPLVTRACVAVQAGLGQVLLSDVSALHRRISGLEQERDTARAQTVAAVSAEATALRRLERDLHDGPQQRLVRLAMELGRAQHHFDTRPEAVREALADAIEQTQEALEELRALSRGIAPPILADRGLLEALTALAARSTITVDLEVKPLQNRLDASVETAAYFVVSEALTNVAKHSRARRCAVGMRQDEGWLQVWVSDDGMGGAALNKGHGLRGLHERLMAVGGRLQVSSPDGGPTTITAQLPCP